MGSYLNIGTNTLIENNAHLWGNAMGTNNYIGSANTLAVGNSDTIGGYSVNAIALGGMNKVQGTASMAFGNTIKINGNYSYGIGRYLKTNADYSIVIGQRTEPLSLTACQMLHVIQNGQIPASWFR